MASKLVDGDTEKNHASNKTEKHLMITSSSPYYLGSSDNLGTPLVAVPLTSENYRNWARSMRTALRVKTKLGFIDGSINKPATKSHEYNDWEKVDSMVTAWIINSTDPTLHGSISYATTARDVWLDLEERFAHTNAPRVHQLWCALCLMQHDSHLSVTNFYTKFKSLLDKLGELQPLPQCNCGASKELAQREQDQHVHLFLGSLDNDRFGHIKGTILNKDPLPSLRRVFNHVLREEARVAAEKGREPKLESGAAFYTNKYKNREGPRPKGDHCGKIGHEKARCYEIIGYPANWDTRRASRDASKKGANGGIARLARTDGEQKQITMQDESAGGHAMFGSHAKYFEHLEQMAGKQIFDKGQI
ncbi:Gag-polypeptide of LTR copia-type [Sesbania bispinosa]|nr:Gag-polypeptide of LTR copia-type [Sesbania bispinosa]